MKPNTLRIDPPKPRKFYNLYTRYTDVYRRFHGLEITKRDPFENKHGSSIRIYLDTEASSLTQTLIDNWTLDGLFPLKDSHAKYKHETKGKREGQIVIGRDSGDISGLALQSSVETIIANGIDAIINAKFVLDSLEKNQQIECQSSLFEEFSKELFVRSQKSRSVFGIFIDSSENDQYSHFQILRGNGLFLEINNFSLKKDLNRISFDAAISGHNPDIKNSGIIEIAEFSPVSLPYLSPNL